MFALDPQPQGNLQVEVPPMARACTLLIPDSGLRQVVCEGRPLTRVEGLDTLAPGTWYRETGRWVYARLSEAAESRWLLFAANNA